MPRLELQNLLKPTTTPEQEILLTWFYNQFDNRSAANKYIINVEPLYYQGLIAGTEFLTYAATKLYIGYCFNTYNTGANNVYPEVTFYDFANAANLNYANVSGFFNVTDLFVRNYTTNDNIYFSRVALINYLSIKFNGYRITLQ